MEIDDDVAVPSKGDREYSDLSSSLSERCHVSPRNETKRATGFELNIPKITKAGESPINIPGLNFEDRTRIVVGGLHSSSRELSRERSRDHSSSLNRTRCKEDYDDEDPNGIRTPGRILHYNMSPLKPMSPPPPRKGGGGGIPMPYSSSTTNSNNNEKGGGILRRPLSISTTASRIIKKSKDNNSSSTSYEKNEEEASEEGLRLNSFEGKRVEKKNDNKLLDDDDAKEEDEEQKGSESESNDEDQPMMSSKMNITLQAPTEDRPKGCAPPPPTVPTPISTPIRSHVSVLSNSPSEYLSESPPAPRGLASPLMTSKNSQKRGGFHWGEIGDSRMGTSTPSSTYALTFPRHNHRTLSSPNLLKSPEILGNIRKRNSPSSKSKQPPDTSPQHARHSVGSTNSGGLSSVGLGRSFSGGGFRV